MDFDEKHIYQQIILPHYLARSHPVTMPEAIIIGGQPGAGKSGLHSFLHQDFINKGGIISVLGDDLRAYHPDYRPLAVRGDPRAIEVTQKTAGDWLYKLTADLLKNRRNIALETTMRKPARVTALIKSMRSAGAARIEVWAMAVNERVSYQSTQLRNESLHLRNNAARDVPKPHHDAAARGMIESLDIIGQEQLANRIVVVLRGGLVAYDSKLAIKGSSAVEVIERERMRPLSAREAQEHEARWQEVLKAMIARNAIEKDVKRIERQREEDLLQINADREATSKSLDRSR